MWAEDVGKGETPWEGFIYEITKLRVQKTRPSVENWTPVCPIVSPYRTQVWRSKLRSEARPGVGWGMWGPWGAHFRGALTLRVVQCRVRSWELQPPNSVPCLLTGPDGRQRTCAYLLWTLNFLMPSSQSRLGTWSGVINGCDQIVPLTSSRVWLWLLKTEQVLSGWMSPAPACGLVSLAGQSRQVTWPLWALSEQWKIIQHHKRIAEHLNSVLLKLGGARV